MLARDAEVTYIDRMRLSKKEVRPTRRAALWVFMSTAALLGMACGGIPSHTGSSPQADDPAPEKGFYATCTTESKGGHKGPWTGPLRADKSDAEKDGKDHEKENSGHVCTIVDY